MLAVHWSGRVQAVLESTFDETGRIMVGNHLALYYILWVGDYARAGMVLDTL